jgi:hypothetical protein
VRGAGAPRAEVPDERAHETVTGILRSYEPHPQASGKPFIGVQLERDDGTDLVVASRSTSAEPRTAQMTPRATIASATRRKPAMLAPAT